MSVEIREIRKRPRVFTIPTKDGFDTLRIDAGKTIKLEDHQITPEIRQNIINRRLVVVTGTLPPEKQEAPVEAEKPRSKNNSKEEGVEE